MNPTTFLDFFIEFSKVPTETIKLYLSVTAVRVPSSVWGARQPYAQALMTAHMLTLRGFGSEGAGGGAVTAETVGDLSRNYETMVAQDSGDASLGLTRYGLEFINLRNEIIVGFTAARQGPRPPLPFPC